MNVAVSRKQDNHSNGFIVLPFRDELRQTQSIASESMSMYTGLSSLRKPGERTCFPVYHSPRTSPPAVVPKPTHVP